MSPSSQSQKLKAYKDKGKGVIIFDFDGVLADSFDTFYKLIKDSMEIVGLSVSKDDYREMFRENVHKGFKRFIGSTKKYSIFQKFRKSNYDRYYKKYKPKLFRGTSRFLKQLNKNYIITIASSGKRTNIIGLLKKGGAHKYFDLILATEEYSKENMIKNILEKHKTDPKKTVVITDTVGDIKIAKKLGLKTIAVDWGFHHKKILKESMPDHLVQTFEDIVKLLN